MAWAERERLAMRTGLMVAALVCASAQADIYFEVTRSGDAADGFWDDAVMGEVGVYDLRIWSDTAGYMLNSTAFDIAGTPANPGTQWVVTSLGTPDPDGLLPMLAFEGTLIDGGITGASVGIIPGLGFEPLAVPVGAANAALIYSGFGAENIAALGRLFAVPTALDMVPGDVNVVSIGIVQTPAPGTVVFALCSMGLVSRRRR